MNVATPAATEGGCVRATCQMPAAFPNPESSTTVGLPVPWHSKRPPATDVDRPCDVHRRLGLSDGPRRRRRAGDHTATRTAMETSAARCLADLFGTVAAHRRRHGARRGTTSRRSPRLGRAASRRRISNGASGRRHGDVAPSGRVRSAVGGAGPNGVRPIGRSAPPPVRRPTGGHRSTPAEATVEPGPERSADMAPPDGRSPDRIRRRSPKWQATGT